MRFHTIPSRLAVCCFEQTSVSTGKHLFAGLSENVFGLLSLVTAIVLSVLKKSFGRKLGVRSG